MPSRLEEARQDEAEVHYPFLDDEVRYLLDYLQALDYVQPGMAGPVCLSFCELESWARLSAVTLLPWEAALLRSMSAAFAQELVAAEDHRRPAPWAPVVETIDREKVARRIKNVLRR